MTLQSIGAYTVLHRICQTPSSEVLLATSQRRGEVALKVVLPQASRQSGLLRQYTHEAAVSALFEHPSLIKVYEFVRDAERPYMVMKYISGRTLKTVIYREPDLVLKQGFRWLVRTAQALGYMHARGYVHLDVKPENILVEDGGEATVIDLALARPIGRRGLWERFRLAVLRETHGTRSYMPPELIKNRNLKPTADIYALGVVMFEMYARRLPLTATDPKGILRLHLTTKPPMLHHVVYGVNPDLSLLISRMLEKTPVDRPQSMDEVIDTLAKIGRPVTGERDLRRSAASADFRP